MSKPTNKYQREIRSAIDPSQTIYVDVYSVLDAFNVTNPATQHAIKKLLCPGQRGVKSTMQDLQEASASLDRAIEIESGRTVILSSPKPEQKPRVQCSICNDPNCNNPNEKH